MQAIVLRSPDGGLANAMLRETPAVAHGRTGEVKSEGP
jgi:hypothetical protein